MTFFLRLFLCFSSLLVLVNCVSSHKVGVVDKDFKAYDAAGFYENIDYRGISFSYDEKNILVSSNVSGLFNGYAINIQDGEASPLTRSKGAAYRTLSYFPKDDRFLVSKDGLGDELHHIFVVGTDGKETDLTPGKSLKARFVGWSSDNKHFYISTNERKQKVFDLYKYSAKDLSRVLIYKDSLGLTGLGTFGSSEISPDGRWLAAEKYHDNEDCDVYLVDLNHPLKKATLVTTQPGKNQGSPTAFTPDGSQLIYLTDAHSEFAQAWSYDIQTQAHKLVYKDDWDIEAVHFSKNGRYKMITLNEDAQRKLRLYDVKANKRVPLSTGAGNVVRAKISPSETQIAYYLETDTSPRNLHVARLNPPAPVQSKTLTHSLSPKINERHLKASEVVRYKSFDGLEIPGILYMPWSASAENPAPAVVYLHGGPGGQSRKGYRPEIQHLVNNGYAVFLINNRGSGGFGKTFYHLDDRKHGDVDLKDCIWARKYLESLPSVDGSRVAIMGGSYGGYLVVAALAFTPDAFNLGIDLFGITNWVRTLKQFPPHWESMKKFIIAEIGDPIKDEKMLNEKSPLFYASKIRKPLLVVQGKNDPRVLEVESREIVAAVRKNNTPVEYLLFEDEGHGFKKTTNRIKASEAYLQFLKTHL